MENIFSPREILKIAVNVELNGKKFYESLEGKAKDGKLRAMWRYLKEQEEIHGQTFQDMLKNIGDYFIGEFSPGEYGAYLRAIASEYILTQKVMEERTKKGFSSSLEAVDFGIYIEKESILTYSALKEYILLAKQSVLGRIIKEEQKHLTDLVTLRDSFKKEE